LLFLCNATIKVAMQDALDTLGWLLDKVQALGADAADALLFETTDVSTSRRMGQPEGLERSENQALGLRAFIGQRQAMVSATAIDKPSLLELAERVVAMARVAPADLDSTLAPQALYSHRPPTLNLLDADEPDTDWLIGQCKDGEEAALAVEGITNSEGADASYGKNRVSLAIAQGGQTRFAHSYESSHFSISVSVLAGSGTGMERDYDFPPPQGFAAGCRDWPRSRQPCAEAPAPPQAGHLPGAGGVRPACVAQPAFGAGQRHLRPCGCPRLLLPQRPAGRAGIRQNHHHYR
jgi:hypothetical protein